MDKKAKIITMFTIAVIAVLAVGLVIAGPPKNTGKPQCKDSKDNDGNGKIDYPNDPGCSSPEDRDESDDPVITACNDGLDNDGDGLVDLNDPGCSSSSDTSELGTNQCDDGIDNTDADTLIDLNDPGCASVTDTSEVDGACDDASDNDGDGFKDYPNDPECGSFADVEHDCSDSDGGRIYTVQGTTSGSFGGTPFSGTDFCVDSVTLTEHYCNPYNLGSENRNCANATTQCLDGSCI